MNYLREKSSRPVPLACPDRGAIIPLAFVTAHLDSGTETVAPDDRGPPETPVPHSTQRLICSGQRGSTPKEPVSLTALGGIWTINHSC